jgi:hypothetical protein
MLARPYLALAGIRLDAVLGARRRMRRLTGLSVVRTGRRHRDAAGPARRISSGAAHLGAGLAGASRSASTAPTGSGCGRPTRPPAHCAPVPGLTVRDVLGGDTSAIGGTVRWSRDGRSLLVLAAPDAPLALPEPPIEPQTDETAGKHSQMATYTDLLSTPTDEDTFEALATTVPCRVDPLTGARQELGPPGLYQSLTIPPTGLHLLVHRLQRPFSFRVPWQLFARRAEVWDAAGTPAAVVADLPVSDEVPRQGVPTGRACQLGGAGAGQPDVGGGPGRRRPVTPADHRDRSSGSALRSPASRSRSPTPATAAWAGTTWTSRTGCCWPSMIRDRRWLTTWLLDLPSRTRPG